MKPTKEGHADSAIPAPVSNVTVQGNVQTTTQATVAVKELPLISTQKDWIDYSAFGINFALLLVGVFGVLYAKRTLKVIAGQLDEIKGASLQTDKMIAAATSQADAARDSANEARDTARLTQCADVLVESISFENATATSAFSPLSRIIVNVKNFGPTRAANLVMNFTLKPGTYGDVSKLTNPVVLGASGSASMAFPRFKEIGIEKDILDIGNGTLPLSFTGTISYDDAFGRTHKIECTSNYKHITGEFNSRMTVLPLSQ